MPLEHLTWVHVGQITNCTLGGPPKSGWGSVGAGK